MTAEQIAELKKALEEIQNGGNAMTEEVKNLRKQIADTEKALADQGKSFADLKKENDELNGHVKELRKSVLNRHGGGALVAPRPGFVSADCAKAVAACIILSCEAMGALEKGGMDRSRRDTLVGVSKEIMGIESKAALTASDIPLPVDYSGEVVELVSQWGAARQYGTIYPLGTGVTKLPRLKTDPTFGLIAMSGSVSEKSPQTEWVTFTAEKFGGLVRLPSEIDADSIVPMGQFLARYCARQLAYVEDWNFFRSTGAGSGLNGSVKGLCESTIDNSKVTQMASTKTRYSDATLANLRAIRAVVDAAVIGRGVYIMHPSFEQHLSGLNTAGDKPYMANGINGASLDGFPIRWVDAMPAYSTSANVSKVFVLFGDFSFQYLGVRPGMGMEVSKEVFFATDELAVRCLERFTIGLMATGAVSGLQTAAS